MTSGGFQPSGAAVSSTGGYVPTPAVVTANSTRLALAGEFTEASTTGGIWSLTLPVAPPAGTINVVKVVAGGTNALTVVGTIDGLTNATFTKVGSGAVYLYDGSQWKKIADIVAPSTYAPFASAATNFATKIRASSSLTLNSTSWADVDTSLDIVLSNAFVGQLVFASVSAMWGSQNVFGFLDVVSVVSAAPVFNWSKGIAENNANDGVTGWESAAVTGTTAARGGQIGKVLVAGDIANDGTCTLRLRYRTASASSKTLFATSADPLIFQAWTPF